MHAESSHVCLSPLMPPQALSACETIAPFLRVDFPLCRRRRHGGSAHSHYKPHHRIYLCDRAALHDQPPTSSSLVHARASAPMRLPSHICPHTVRRSHLRDALLRCLQHSLWRSRLKAMLAALRWTSVLRWASALSLLLASVPALLL